MAILATYTQQPGEKLDYDIYYTGSPGGEQAWLNPTDSIQSVTVDTVPVGLTVTYFLTPGRVKLWASGGATGVVYKTTVTVTTTEGREKQDEVKFRVRDY